MKIEPVTPYDPSPSDLFDGERAESLRALAELVGSTFDDAYEAIRWVDQFDWRLAMWMGFETIKAVRADSAEAQAILNRQIAKIDAWFRGTMTTIEIQNASISEEWFSSDNEQLALTRKDELLFDAVYWHEREVVVGQDEDRYGGREAIAHVGYALVGGMSCNRAPAFRALMPHVAASILRYPTES